MTTFDDWIGRSREVTGSISAELETQFQATLDGHLWQGNGLSLGLHWCLAPDIVVKDQLAVDGHPARTDSADSFMPPLPMPARMWAGGTLTFRRPFDAGKPVTRRSEIASISHKHGNSGELYLVEVAHDYSCEGQVHLQEVQTIVYKEARRPGDSADYAPGDEGFDPVTLFRYSAMTFNGHRIHYDADYSRDVEHYPNCVVHGPLQATILLNHAAKKLGRLPNTFSYRGKAALFVNEPWSIEDTGEGEVLITGPAGRVTTSARYSW